MKIRTVYFKVSDMQKAASFWRAFLGVEPHKTFDTWHEFMVGELRLGLWLNRDGHTFSGSNCVPVFEFTAQEAIEHVEKAKGLGCKTIYAGLDDPNVQSEVLEDPLGNQFEISKFHD